MMQPRDSLKGREYFVRYIGEKQHHIAEYKAIVATQELGAEHRASLHSAIFREQLELWIAQYSAGETISALRDTFPEVLESFAAYLDQEKSEPIDFDGLTDYIQSLWLVSIAILLDLSDDVLHRLVSHIDQTGTDALFDWLLGLRIPQLAVSSSLIHEQPYLPLYRALGAEGEERDRLIQRFIDQFYEHLEGVYWFDTQQTTGAYFGFWLFELAAFVKGEAIDDRSFADNIHFPSDLV